MAAGFDIKHLQNGPPADAELAELLDYIGKGTTPIEDIFSNSITGTVKDAWRAWYKARTALNNNRTTEAADYLKSSTYLQPIKEESDNLADIERALLISECLQAGYQIESGLNYSDIAHFGLLRFIKKYNNKPEDAVREIEVMMNTIASIDLSQLSYAPAEIYQSWAATRGMAILQKIAQITIDLYPVSAGRAAVESIVNDMIAAVNELKASAGCAFARNSIADFAFTIANCLTAVDPGQAIEYFRISIDASDYLYAKKLTARNNIANCLVRLGKFKEAIPIYEQLIPYWRDANEYAGLARIQIALCIALWKSGERSRVHDLLVESIQLYESKRAGDHSILSRYQHKGFIDEGYLLLITLNCSEPLLSEPLKEEIIAAATAILSKDQLAHVGEKTQANGWEGLIDNNSGPLNQIKFTLRPFPNHSLLLLISGIDCLIWIMLGFNGQGDFIFETSITEAEHAKSLIRFLELMATSLDADLNDDKALLFETNNQLKEESRSISSTLSPSFIAALEKMEHIYYLPHPFGNVDEFPVGGLTIGQSWLAQRCSITRVPTYNAFRELLAINRAVTYGGRRSVVIHGSAALGDVVLKKARENGQDVNRFLGIYGFSSEIKETFTKDDIVNWLNGEVSVVHYIGHGISGDTFEGLPIDGKNYVDIHDIDKIAGSRTPFVFICACLAGRVRAGRGGYQAGIASKIAERAAPAVVAFNMPVTEERAYFLAKEFYRNAKNNTFGDAIKQLFNILPEEFPAYAWLSLTAYGDPSYPLASVVASDFLPMANQRAKTWDSIYRLHAVLRTAKSFDDAADSIASAPKPWQKDLQDLLQSSFGYGKSKTIDEIDELEMKVFESAAFTDFEKMSLYSFIVAERFFLAGVDTLPVTIPEDRKGVRELFDKSNNMMSIAGFLFDMRLNGLVFTLQARLLTAAQQKIDRYILLRYRTGKEKLLECEDISPFVKRLNDETTILIEQLGVQE